MKTMKFLTYATFVLFMGIAMSSCKPSDGADGADGAAGPAGADGADGNANVSSVNFDAPTWTVGSYLGSTANTYTHTTTLLTQDILDHGAILGYCTDGTSWYPLPYHFFYNGGSTNEESIVFTYSLNTINLYAYSNSGVLNPGLFTAYRFLLITDNMVAGRVNSDNKQTVYSELETAGIDINNYEEVCAYYGINPE